MSRRFLLAKDGPFVRTMSRVPLFVFLCLFYFFNCILKPECQEAKGDGKQTHKAKSYERQHFASSFCRAHSNKLTSRPSRALRLLNGHLRSLIRFTCQPSRAKLPNLPTLASDQRDFFSLLLCKTVKSLLWGTMGEKCCCMIQEVGGLLILLTHISWPLLPVPTPDNPSNYKPRWCFIRPYDELLLSNGTKWFFRLASITVFLSYFFYVTKSCVMNNKLFWKQCFLISNFLFHHITSYIKEYSVFFFLH